MIKNSKLEDINFRYVNLEDKNDLLLWRNDPLTRKMSIEQNEISKEQHFNWLKNALSNKNISLYMVESKMNKIATVRFDTITDAIKVSINLNPTFRKKGFAKDILSLSIKEIRKKWSFNTIVAEIKDNNTASIKIFEHCGFKKKATNNKIHTYIKS